jgi:hypothetical protein
MLAPGRYRIRGKDELDGFPDPTFWLSTDPKAKFPEISVIDEDVTDVNVVLGSRGAIVYGSVQNAKHSDSHCGCQIADPGRP